MEPTTTFNDFNLSTEVLNAISQKGFEKPTAIQALTIPHLLENRSNVIAQAQTGTGKTAAFGLPLVEKIDVKKRTIQALILVPTRELALQVASEIESLKGKKAIQIVPIYGGQSIEVQLRKLKRTAHIVVGTPGRIIDHLKRRTVSFDQIDHLILDEADEMLNMGFIEDMEEIMRHTNPDKRTLLFSATMPTRIKKLAKKYINDFKLIRAQSETLTPGTTEHFYYEVPAAHKLDALCRLIDFQENFYGLIFCRTRKDAAQVADQLAEQGYKAEAIHGEISQGQRERSLKRFKSRKVNILVATDVAARGIDVQNLTHVVNFAIPQDADSYIHRIGRTGRAGKTGIAITLVTKSERKRLVQIQQAAAVKIQKATLPNQKTILMQRKSELLKKLTAATDSDVSEEYVQWAKELLQENEAVEVLAFVLQHSFQLPSRLPDEVTFSQPAKRRTQSKQRQARLFIAVGRKDQLNPKKLVQLLSSKADIKAPQIREVKVKDNFSFVTVPFDKALNIIKNLKQSNGRSLAMFAHE